MVSRKLFFLAKTRQSRRHSADRFPNVNYSIFSTFPLGDAILIMNEFLFFISFSACVFGVIITAGGFFVQYAGTMILQVLLSFVFW